MKTWIVYSCSVKKFCNDKRENSISVDSISFLYVGCVLKDNAINSNSCPLLAFQCWLAVVFFWLTKS